jgi:hypothetical protein
MEERKLNEVDDETRPRGVKRTSDNKIAEVSTSKSKKRAKKAQAEAIEPAVGQNLFEDSFQRSEESVKRSRLADAARDVADGKITIEEPTEALLGAVTEWNIRLGSQGAFYNPPEEPAVIELDMKAFNRSARAIAIRRERTAALMRNSRPLPSSDINLGVSNSSEGGSDPSSPIADPQLLASTPHFAAMTPGCATEPPGSETTTVRAHAVLQSYAIPLVSHSRPMGSIQLLMTPLVSLPSHNTNRLAQRQVQSNFQP